MKVSGQNRIDLSRWYLPAAAIALLLALLLFVFPYNSGDSSINSPIGIALWTIWTTTDATALDHTYCLLVPFMVAYVIYEKRKELARMPALGDTRAIVAIVLGLFLFWLGARAGKQYLGCAGMQVLIAGIICWFWGTAVFRKLLFAWAIIAFAWPLPFLDTAVAFPLRMTVSQSAFHVLNFIGVPTIQSGTALLSASTATESLGSKFQIDVADPCSGLHSLLPLLMFSAFYCYFFLPKTWQKWTVFPSAFIFAIAGNVARILLLVFGCLQWGTAYAIGTNEVPSAYHENCGFFVFVVALGLECLFGYLLISIDKSWLKTPDASKAKADASAPAEPLPAAIIPAWRSNTVFGLAAVVLIVHFTSPPVFLPSEAGVIMSLPEEVKLANLDGGHFYGKKAPVSEAEHTYLPKDTEFCRNNYSDFHGHDIFFSIVLSGVQQYTIHPPEVCLVAQGWTITGHEDIPVRLKTGHDLTVRNLSLKRDALTPDKKITTVHAYYMYWYVADNITTPSHLERNLRSSWDRIVHNRDHRWAYVFAMAAISDSYRADGLNATQTKEMLGNFIGQIVPTFQKNEIHETPAGEAISSQTTTGNASL